MRTHAVLNCVGDCHEFYMLKGNTILAYVAMNCIAVPPLTSPTSGTARRSVDVTSSSHPLVVSLFIDK